MDGSSASSFLAMLGYRDYARRHDLDEKGTTLIAAYRGEAEVYEQLLQRGYRYVTKQFVSFLGEFGLADVISRSPETGLIPVPLDDSKPSVVRLNHQLHLASPQVIIDDAVRQRFADWMRRGNARYADEAETDKTLRATLGKDGFDAMASLRREHISEGAVFSKMGWGGYGKQYASTDPFHSYYWTGIGPDRVYRSPSQDGLACDPEVALVNASELSEPPGFVNDEPGQCDTFLSSLVKVEDGL